MFYDYAWIWWSFIVLIVLIPAVALFVVWALRYARGREPEKGSDDVPQGPHTGVGPAGYLRPDSAVLDEISDRLTRHGEIDASGIRLKVDQGVVVLTGHVPDRKTRRLAEQVADSVSGVQDVINELQADKTRTGGPRRAA